MADFVGTAANKMRCGMGLLAVAAAVPLKMTECIAKHAGAATCS
jgi:hypothetical protein